MVRKIAAALIFIPLVLVILAFAMANRQFVTLSFDPLDQASPAYGVSLPLFALIFLVLIAGVVLGGFAAWLRQGKWRRAARRLDAEARELHVEIDAMRQRFGEVERSEPVSPSRRHDPPLTIPPPAA